jgi:hypothetical protein
MLIGVLTSSTVMPAAFAIALTVSYSFESQ